jgi:hypothetical protein
MPGTLTNPSLPFYTEPHLLIISDPQVDSQAVTEATNAGVPVIGISNTDNLTSKLDLVIPANNRGRKALATVYWLLAREILIQKGELTEDQDMKYEIDDFETKIKDIEEDEDEDLSNGDTDDDDSDDEYNEEFSVEKLSTEEVSQLYESMKETIADLTQQNEILEQSNIKNESEILNYESYANEWDAQNRLGEDRSRVLFAKLRLDNEALQAQLDTAYQEIQIEKAKAVTWQNTIENKLLDDENTDIAHMIIGETEVHILISQFKQDLLRSQTQLAMERELKLSNKHKQIEVELREQFGPGLLNTLEYLLQDADLHNVESFTNQCRM